MKIIRVALAIVGYFCLISADISSYEGHKLYRISPQTSYHMRFLKKLSLHEDVYDFVNFKNVIVNPNRIKEFEEDLDRKGIAYKIIDENVGKTIKRNFEKNQAMQKLFPYSGRGRLGTNQYYSHTVINAYLEYLAQEYPHRVYVKKVGRSFQERDLKTLTITNGDGRANKNVILVDGGFHAREWISPATALYAIDQLVENFEENQDLLQDFDWIILPVVNADGYDYSQQSPENRMWRKTRKPLFHEGGICYGTDPNRNFDFHWMEEGASADPCSQTFAGPKPFSEPEAMVVRDLILTHGKRKGQMYLTLHSKGNLILYPWGWTSDMPDTWPDLHEVAEAGAEAIYAATGTNYTIGSSTNVLYVAAGASDDYAFNAGFPISFTMELPAGGETGFDPPVEMIDVIVKETWVGVRAMALKVMEKYPLE
ncbi:carboxypeptidase B1-like [Haematobia irritans]|uniref:Putative carboxypeptidase b n=1 Tax=Haematobia irritans TaxID=7368 RepID=A0A1L8EGL9_HAEIR